MTLTDISRRSFFGSFSVMGLGMTAGARGQARTVRRISQNSPVSPIDDSFPSQHPDLVREMVGVSHGNFERVKKLVESHPALAKASWDWGFGDHETALGAASHVGNREIALLLIEKGAPPTLFSATMLGQLEAVRAMVESPKSLMNGFEVQRLPGPHGIPLLAHAEMGGEEARPVLDYLTSLGGANERPEAAALSDEDRATCAGTYSFGEGGNDRLIVTDDRSSLWIKRGDEGTVRGLTHRGNFEFSPAGAPAVRICFYMGGPEVPRLRVIDGDFMLEAQRT
jgi:hypothetical protein